VNYERNKKGARFFETQCIYDKNGYMLQVVNLLICAVYKPCEILIITDKLLDDSI